MDQRPRCSVEGCNSPRQHMGTYRVDGTPLFRDVCTKHHNKNVGEKHGLKNINEVMAKNAGFSSVAAYIADKNHKTAIKEGFANFSELQNYRAQKKGFTSYTDYMNSKHRYRKNRKMYCENVTGEAVWIDPDTGKPRKMKEIVLNDTECKCTATIIHPAQLSVDHINGDHHDDRDENHQTLCHNCHKIKSLYSKDHWSDEKKKTHLVEMTKLTASKKVKKPRKTGKITKVKRSRIKDRIAA